MNAVCEFEALALQRPGLEASPIVVAAWYEAKARVHEGLAAAAVSAVEREHEIGYARAARQHAARLVAVCVV